MSRVYLVKSLRRFRKWHRLMGLILAFFLAVSAGTGILLAFKKEFALIQPPTQKEAKLPLAEWKPLSELAELATAALYQQYPEQQGNPVSRMDVRPGKGVVKVLFKKGYWEVQISGSSGEVKSIAQRHSDWIEALHDGSIISDGFKLVAMSVLGFGLLFLLGSGLWLYIGPKEIKKERQRQKKEQT